MDPVSIAASSIALIDACRKLAAGLKFLRGLSKAPEDFLALTDLQNVLKAIRLVTRKRQDNVSGDLLAPLFSKVDPIIHELCNVCGNCSRTTVSMLRAACWLNSSGRGRKIVQASFAND